LLHEEDSNPSALRAPARTIRSHRHRPCEVGAET